MRDSEYQDLKVVKLPPGSVLDVRYNTDDVEVDWTTNAWKLKARMILTLQISPVSPKVFHILTGQKMPWRQRFSRFARECARELSKIFQRHA